MSRLAEARVLVGGAWKRAGRTDVGGSTAPAVAGPFFGATPTNGVSNKSTATTVTKYGHGASCRIYFSTSDLTQRFTRDPNVSVVHVSYKPAMAEVAAGQHDADIKALLDSLHNGDILTFWHEPDNNGWTSGQITDWKNGTNHLYDLTKSYKPGVLIAPVFTGGLMANYTADSQRQTWCTNLRSDLFGIDCDGVAIKSTEANYNRISYADELDNGLAYMSHPSNSGFKALTVPEHVTARVNPPDPDGSLRAAWFTAQTNLMISAGCYAVMCWDFDSSSHNTTTNFNHLPASSPELAVWQNLVTTNPATPS